jgi:serine/threonine protein kinase/HEAT repeat protein
MIAAITPHPSAEELHAYGEGRLAPEAVGAVERHIAQCDSCCRLLASASADSFLGRLRKARRPLLGIKAVAAPSRPAVVPGIPPELIDHPRYRVLGLIGQGGMGAVYRAEHRRMERPVALKVINPALMRHPATVERFQQEVRTAARLHHPNIVTAYDADQAGNPPLHFLVMEYVEGQSLADLVRQRGPLPVAEACEYVRQAALGLQHAHEQGMVHRDVKPHNLMRTPRGQVKILDFGLARLARTPGHFAPADTVMGSRTLNNHPTPARPLALTGAGTVMGTADYIAPEQAADPRTADIRADIYALGCTLYFLLVGRPPFPESTDREKIARHAATPLPPLPELPSGLAAVLARMTAKAPADRFATPAEVARALALFAGVRDGPRQRSRKGRLLAAGLLLVALMVVGIVLRLQSNRGVRTGQAEQDRVAAKTPPTDNENKRDTPPERPVPPKDDGTEQGPSYQGKTLSKWIAQLHAKDANAREEASQVIGRITWRERGGGKGASPAFTPAVNDPKGMLLPALAHAFTSKDDVVKGRSRRLVVGNFLRLYGEKAVPVFMAALKDPDTEVRWLAVDGLHELITGEGGVSRVPWSRLKPAAVKSLIPVLAEVLVKDKDDTVRGVASAALRDVGCQEHHSAAVVPILVAALKSEDQRVRESAVGALGGLGAHARKAVPALAELLKEEDPHFRSLVARSLYYLGHSDATGEAVPALIAATKAQDSGGKAAAEALGRIRKAPRSTAPALLALLKDPEPDIRLRAVKFLCDLGEGDKECLAVLLELLKRRDPTMRQEVLKLLRPYGSAAKDAAPTLGDILRTDSDETCVYAIEVLGAIGPGAKAALPALKGLEKQYQNELANLKQEMADRTEALKKAGQNETVIKQRNLYAAQRHAVAQIRVQAVQRVLAKIEQ